MNKINASAILLPDVFSSYEKSTGDKLTAIEPLGKINMIVGANNSGKSRFMRLLSSQNHYEFLSRSVDINCVNEGLKKTLQTLERLMAEHQLSEIDSVSTKTIEDMKSLPHAAKTGHDVYTKIRAHLYQWGKMEGFSRASGPGAQWALRDNVSISSKVKEIAILGLKALENLPIEPATPKKIYVPILRGLRPLDESHTDFYAKRTLEDYFLEVEESARPEIFTGLSFYKKLTELLLGSNAERKQIVEYQRFISKELFEGREVALIPSQNNKVVTIKIGKETEQPVHHLGDGIQAAIILSFLPFITEYPTFFFIEEPESHMHPGLQRKVLELFARDSKHTFFLTTHSNHLLDITIDLKETSIFNFRKSLNHDADDDEQLADVIVEAVNVGSHSSLEQLGVRNSSVFLVNATIWVEGITDRKYLRALLRSYTDYLEKEHKPFFKPEEDVHYSFVEYAGNNITHWSFLENEEHPIEVERLCAKAMVIVDQDGDTKLARKDALEKKLGDRFCIVEGREIENILPPEIIREVVALYEKKKPQDLPEFEFASYQNEYIGAYIQKTLGKAKRKGGYEGDSGTIKQKVQFCEKASVFLENFEFGKLPVPTQTLGKRIYEFILDNNRV